VAVTGYPGSAAAGLDMLTNNLRFEPEVTTYLRNAFFRPLPRIGEGQLLVNHGVVTAIDISDGLIADLKQICKASQVSARIETDRLPIHPIVKDSFGDRSLELALTGGEDYELLFTASIEVINRIKGEARCPVTIIGEIAADSPGEVSIFDARGNPVNIHKAGWEHFRTG
jgi:thiamine-monophosphate kinase